MVWKALLSVAAVVGLLVAADRVAVEVVESVAAERLAESPGLTQSPDVEIAGFPVLTQLAQGRLDRVDVSARDVPVSGTGGLELETLDAALREVSREGETVMVERVRAEGVVSFENLSELLGVAEMRYVDPGTIAVETSVVVLGESLATSVTVSPTITDGVLDFSQFALDDGPATDAVSGALEEVFGVTLPLQGLPFDVAAQSLEVQRDGVHLVLTGRDVVYTGGS